MPLAPPLAASARSLLVAGLPTVAHPAERAAVITIKIATVTRTPRAPSKQPHRTEEYRPKASDTLTIRREAEAELDRVPGAPIIAVSTARGTAKERDLMPKGMLVGLSGLVLLAGATLAWNADAATLNGVSSLPALVHSYSPVEKTGRCVCGPRGCACGPRRGWGFVRSEPWWGRPGALGRRQCWWRRGVQVCHW